MDAKKRMSSAKGNVTRVLTLLEEQEGLDLQYLRVATLDRLLGRLTKAEEQYENAYQSLEEPSDDDDSNQSDFLSNIDDAKTRLEHLKLTITTHGLEEDLLELLDYWESLSEDELRQKVDREIDTLQTQVEKFIEITRPRKLASSPHIKDLVKSLRKRVDKLKVTGTPSPILAPAPTSTGSDSSKTFSQGIKSRTLPLPTYSGDLSDWRSFWRRFKDYLSRMPDLTTDEKLTFLLECIKEPAAISIIRDALRNGDSFEFVEIRLKTRFDQPRRVYTDMAIKLKRIPEIQDTDKGTAMCSELISKFLNIIDKFGDGSASQLITAFFESMLDDSLTQEWYRYLGDSDKVPQAKRMVEFMDLRNRILTSKSVDSRSTTPRSNHNKLPLGKIPPSKPPSKEKGKSITLVTNTDSACRLCNGKEHALYYCDKFKEMDIPARRQFMTTTNHCFNCLGLGHTTKQCHSRKTCRSCSGKHHSLLHLEEANRAQVNASTTDSNTSATAPPETSLALPVPRPTAILWVCQAVIEQDGRTQVVRGIIDPGSTISFITEKVVKSLRLQTTPMITEVTGIGSTHAETSRFETNILLKSPYELGAPPTKVRAAVIRSIVGDTPSTELLKDVDISFTNSLNLSDPNFKTPGGIDLLLGQDVIKRILRDGVVRSSKNDLYAINTVFGWVVGGCCDEQTEAVTTHVCYHITSSTTGSTDSLLKAFWEAEEPPTTPVYSEEDQQALSHFQKTHSRHDDGRYVVRLPWKTTTDKLGNSKKQAMQRYLANRQSLVRKGKWDEFSKAVLEYGQLGHAELVPLTDLNKPACDVYYLPMHGVSKSSSTTTKLRVVFDASAVTPTGHSLNSLLLPGPTCYPLLTNVLIRFRLPKIGLSADISKMFREVALHPEDRDMHRFLMEDDAGVLRDWRMVRLTFGITCSPFLAIQVLHQLAEDHKNEFPAAARAIQESFYVDDFLSGADTVEEATALRRSLNELLFKARMTLRKWRTNSTELRATIPNDLLETEDVQLIQAPSECHKTLGIHWRTSTDTLHIATPQLCMSNPPTKRQVLSDVARTFDVLGWFTPVTIALKILLQRVWLLGLDWDQVLPPELTELWQQWREELPLMTEYSIPRTYFSPGKTVQALQLHGFCDASQMAIAAVVYVRALYTDASVSVQLVVAKSRVAPVKPQTVPKLELSSAALLSKLLYTVREELHIDYSAVFAWSDSMITLGWIRTTPARLKTYVANRVVQITDHIPPVHWRHVPTKSNPADVASRGTTTTDLIQHSLWWHGPEWLCLPPTDWPARQELIAHLPELKSFALTIQAEPVEKESILLRFSSYLHCINVCAWLYRYVDNSRKSQKLRNLSSTLTLAEIDHAELSLFKIHQHSYFSKEIALLKSGNPVSTSSSLHPLHPFLDKDGLLCVGGRLQQSELPYYQKHPIILYKKSYLTHLIVTHLHTTNHHAGPTLMMGLLSQRYHILGARKLVRSISHDCVVCRKEYARTAAQQMGQLPSVRVRPAPPFSRTGTDFAGPLLLKKGHTRKPIQVKGYVCLFICLSTRAVHLELVMDLSTEAFLSAFRRFTARRGCPEELFSDNGSNFVGANRELACLYALLTSKPSVDTITHYFNNARIKWTFIPGRAPHFGGLWEAGVKSAKTILHKIVGSHVLTVEECITVLADVEATLNSRPLCPLESSPEDGVEVLTPAHFLVGRSLKAPPQLPSDQLLVTARKRWNLCQKMSSDFWSRWSSEYLQILQKRNKWTKQTENLRPGQVVLLKDQDLFLRSWPLAVVEKVYPGPDGLVRAVTIRTAKGTYSRPITKLIPLFDSSDDCQFFPPGEDVQAAS